MGETAAAPAKAKAPETAFSGAVATSKDLFSLLRDATLFVFAMLLMLFPAGFNSILERAGFEEGSFAGLKWRSKLADSDTALKEARTTIADLQKNNQEMAALLEQAQSQIKAPGLEQQIVEARAKTQQLGTAVRRMEASVTRTIDSNAPLVAKAAASAGGDWGVVWSGDSTLNGANYEVNVVARQLGIADAAVYLRQGSYRSVARVASQQAANQLLPTAQKRRADAYVVNLSRWCPSPTEKSGFIECGAK